MVMFKRRIATLFGTATLVLGSMLGTAAVADAAVTLAVCTGGEIEIYIDEDNDDLATVEGFLTGCTALGNPNIHSATITGSGAATVNTALLLAVTTSDTITWNTGQSTTVTSIREWAGIGIVVMAGEDATLGGLFHPAAGAEVPSEAGRSSQPGGSVAYADFDDGSTGNVVFAQDED
jgi:hypothetical protein